MSLDKLPYLMEMILKNLIYIPSNLIWILILRAKMLMQVWSKDDYNHTRYLRLFKLFKNISILSTLVRDPVWKYVWTFLLCSRCAPCQCCLPPFIHHFIIIFFLCFLMEMLKFEVMCFGTLAGSGTVFIHHLLLSCAVCVIGKS